MSVPSIRLAASLALSVAAAAAASDSHQLRIVVKSGDPAPGSFNGTFTVFGPIDINASGQVAFQATTTGPLADTGLWMTEFADPQSIELIAGEDWPVPGAPGVQFGRMESAFFSPHLNDAGNVGFSALVTVPADAVGIFRKVDGIVELVALPGQPMQGAGVGTTIASLGNLIAFNDDDLVTTTVFLAGPSVHAGNDSAVALTWFGGFQIVAREGGGAPGLPGRTFGSFQGALPVLGSNGQVGFTVPLSGAPAAAWSRWRGWPGGLQLLAKQGDPTPYGAFTPALPMTNPLSFSETGAAFRAWMQDAPTEVGLWHAEPGQAPSLLAKAGAPAPIGTYDQFLTWSTPTAADGSVLFAARCVGPGVVADNDSIVVRRAPGGPAQMLVRENDHAVGYGPQVVFDDLADVFLETGFEASDTGWTLLRARVRGPGITPANRVGLWAIDPEGSLRWIMRTGATLGIGDGVKTVADLLPAFGIGSESGRQKSINDRGDVAFRVWFTDNSTAILLALAPPECWGDLNGDGVVDSTDLGILLGAWGTTGPYGTGGDVNLSGETDAADLAALLGAWGVCKE